MVQNTLREVSIPPLLWCTVPVALCQLLHCSPQTPVVARLDSAYGSDGPLLGEGRELYVLYSQTCI